MSEMYYGSEKVGETFEYNEKKYKVMACESDGDLCMNCVFREDNEIASCCEMACESLWREDEKDVYYIEVSQ